MKEITSKQANYLLTCIDVAVDEGFVPDKEESQVIQQLQGISKGYIDQEFVLDIPGILAIGNGEKCPFCDIIIEQDTNIILHMSNNHKKKMVKALL